VTVSDTVNRQNASGKATKGITR